MYGGNIECVRSCRVLEEYNNLVFRNGLREKVEQEGATYKGMTRPIPAYTFQTYDSLCQ